MLLRGAKEGASLHVWEREEERALVCVTQLYLCRCRRRTVSLPPLRTPSWIQASDQCCLALPARAYSTVSATQPGIHQAGRRSAAQVTLPPLSRAQLACPALSALLAFCSATLVFFFIPCVSCTQCFNAISARERKGKVMCLPPTRSPHTHLPCL